MTRRNAPSDISVHEVLEQDLLELLVPARFHEDYRKALPLLRDAPRDRALERTMEMAAIRRDGEEIPVELSVSTFRLDGPLARCRRDERPHLPKMV